MYYSVTFTNEDTGDKKNTWEDWHLISAKPPMVPPPEEDFNFVEIPGRKKGPLDLTGALTNGESTFKNSEGSWDFLLADDKESRVELSRTIRNFIHGRRLRVQMEDDPDHYWLGRFTLSEPEPGKAATGFTINYWIEPTEYSTKEQTDVQDSDWQSGDL